MSMLALRLSQAAAAAALALSGIALSSGAATAQPWTHLETRCSDEGACASFRCNDDGDHCTRVSDWSSGDVNRSYYYSNDSRWATQDRRTLERCNGNLCATYRCNIDGDDCVRLTGWRWRY